MAKRRRNKRSLDRSRGDDDDDEIEERPKRSSGKQSGKPGSDSKVDLIMFLSLIFIIIIIVGGYFAYTIYFVGDEDDDNDELVNPPRRELELQVISDITYNFDKSSTHQSDLNGNTYFMLLATNKGEATDTFEFKSSGGASGMSLSFDKTTVTVKKDGAMVVIATVTTPSSGFASYSVTATSTNDVLAKDVVTLNIDAHDLNDRQAQYGDEVNVHYVLVDRGTDAAFNPDKWQFNQDGEFPFTVGEGVIEGFSIMASGMKAGETRVAILPADQSYGNDPGDERPDGDLAYEMFMKEIK